MEIIGDRRDSDSVRKLNCAGLIVREGFIANCCREGVLLDKNSNRNNRRYIFVAVHAPAPTQCGPRSIAAPALMENIQLENFGRYNFPLFPHEILSIQSFSLLPCNLYKQ